MDDIKKFFIVSEENLLKNVKQMDKALKQLEIDLKNAQTNKMAPANDKFVPVMEISFWKNNMYTSKCFAQYNIFLHLFDKVYIM